MWISSLIQIKLVRHLIVNQNRFFIVGNHTILLVDKIHREC